MEFPFLRTIYVMRVGILAIILTPICVALIWLCLTVFEPSVILYQAERIAGDRPYCIVVAAPERPLQYRKISNRSDLTYSALTVRVDTGGSIGPIAETYYALLIMGNPVEVRNWSKRYLNFERDVEPMQSSLADRNPYDLCKPAADFAKAVPW